MEEYGEHEQLVEDLHVEKDDKEADQKAPKMYLKEKKSHVITTGKTVREEDMNRRSQREGIGGR